MSDKVVVGVLLYDLAGDLRLHHVCLVSTNEYIVTNVAQLQWSRASVLLLSEVWTRNVELAVDNRLGSGMYFICYISLCQVGTGAILINAHWGLHMGCACKTNLTSIGET